MLFVKIRFELVEVLQPYGTQYFKLKEMPTGGS